MRQSHFLDERIARALASPLRRACLSTLGLCSVLAAPAQAQWESTPPFPFDPITRSVGLPPTSESWARGESGDFNHDGVPDVAVQRGGQLRIVLGPDHYLAGYDLAPGVTDFASFERGNQHATDALVLARQGGVEIWRRDGLTGALETELVTGAWGIPKAVDAHTNDANYSTIAVLDADGTTVYAQLWQRASATEPGQWFSHYPVLHAMGPVHDMRLVDWDGGGTTELAVVHGGVLVIYDLSDGSLLAYMMGVDANAMIEVLQQESPGPERLAVLTGAAGARELELFDLAHGGETVDLGDLEVFDLDSGRLHGPGLVDVVLATDIGVVVLQNLNDPGGVTYVLPPVAPGTPHTIGPSGVVVGDMDNDGDPDLFASEDGAAEGLLAWNGVEWAGSLRPTVQSNRHQDIPGGLRATFDLFVPSGVPAGAQVLEVIAWSNDLIAGPGGELLSHTAHSFTPGQSLEVTIDLTPAVLPEAYLVEFRLAGLDPRIAYPAAIGVYTDDTARFIDICLQYGGGVAEAVPDDDKKGGIVIIIEPPEFPGPNPPLPGPNPMF